jgi:diguanylate cyclase (GGDEF)-like protein
MRQEVLAPRMMQAALEALLIALGAEGCAVVEMVGDGVQASVLHQLGDGLPLVRETVLSLLEAGPTDATQANAPDGRPVLVCPTQGRVGEQAGLALWRQPGGRTWDADELMLAASATSVTSVILGREAVEREMAQLARTDPLTGLLNRRAFLDEIARRVERLERDALPGTLMFVGLDNFKDLNDQSGHDAGDEALRITAALLRATLRPTDLVARFGGDEFATWLDGTGQSTAAERAESLHIEGLKALAHLGAGRDVALTMSIGIATRLPGCGEAIESTIHQAGQAMHQVRRTGRGHWRIAQPGQT